jgi:hypothetical protein
MAYFYLHISTLQYSLVPLANCHGPNSVSVAHHESHVQGTSLNMKLSLICSFR